MSRRSLKKLALCFVLLVCGWAGTAGDVHADANGAPWILTVNYSYYQGCTWRHVSLSNGDSFTQFIGCNYNG